MNINECGRELLGKDSFQFEVREDLSERAGSSGLRPDRQEGASPVDTRGESIAGKE